MDPTRYAGGVDDYALRGSSIATLRAQLRRALARPRPTHAYYLASRHKALRDVAVRGALVALARGDVAWSFILNGHWGVPQKRARAAIEAAARRCPPRALPSLSTALGQVGGRAARALIEPMFLRLKSRRPRSWRDYERLYDAAGALVRLSPNRVDAAELLVEGLRHEDLLARSCAARAVAWAHNRRAGAGLELIRKAMRELVDHPDPEIFFVVERWLLDVSRPKFLRGCERLLRTSMADIATDRLIRHGGNAERAKVLRMLRLRRSFALHIMAMNALGKNAPREALVRVLRRGLARRSPLDRHRTIWLLQSAWRGEFTSIARRAWRREPDAELRACLQDLLERRNPSAQHK